MNSTTSITRAWNVLCWNVRGINAPSKHDAVRARILEGDCSVVCLQETKKVHFDLAFVKQLAPRRLDHFSFVPASGSLGKSGGLITIWDGALFTGTVIDLLPFALHVLLQSNLSAVCFHIVNIYGPCTSSTRPEFLDWLCSLDIGDEDDLVFLGDFNLYRSLENRNRPGGNIRDILDFNNTIAALELNELPLIGRAFTWSNMQEDPLLEQVDWFFTSNAWMINHRNTSVRSLVRATSDHVPCGG